MDTAILNSTIEFFKNIAIAVGIGIGGYVLAILIGRVVKTLFSKFIKGPWDDFLAILFRLVVLFLTIKIIVDLTGTAGALVVVVTGITAAFAIGSERLAADAISSIKLMFVRYYRVGDLVTIGGKFGLVDEINMAFTGLRSQRTDRIIIPNSEAVNQIVVNHSQIAGHRIDITIPIIGDHDHEAIIQIIRKAAAKYPGQMEGEKFNPEVLLTDVGAETWYYTIWLFIPETPLPTLEESKLRLKMVNALKAQQVKVGVAPVYHPELK
jgi:small-conductance mechanosensitive channel